MVIARAKCLPTNNTQGKQLGLQSQVPWDHLSYIENSSQQITGSVQVAGSQKEVFDQREKLSRVL